MTTVGRKYSHWQRSAQIVNDSYSRMHDYTRRPHILELLELLVIDQLLRQQQVYRR